MPRPWVITVNDFRDLKPREWLDLRVERTDKAGQNAMAVELAHLDAEQAGRTHTIHLDLPPRPAGLAHDFLAACGFDVAIGAEINPREAVGKTVLARFARNQGGVFEIAAFKQPEKEIANDDPTQQPTSNTGITEQ